MKPTTPPSSILTLYAEALSFDNVRSGAGVILEGFTPLRRLTVRQVTPYEYSRLPPNTAAKHERDRMVSRAVHYRIGGFVAAAGMGSGLRGSFSARIAVL
jgi:hypothetical protein